MKDTSNTAGYVDFLKLLFDEYFLTNLWGEELVSNHKCGIGDPRGSTPPPHIAPKWT